MKYLLHYISRKNLFVMVSLVTFQQGLNAFGTFALAKAGLSFQNRSLFAAWALTSLVLFILTPGASILIRRLENRVSYHAYGVFLNDHLFSLKGDPSIWQNKSHKDRYLASIGSDASDYLGLMLFVSLDIYAFGLSIVLGVLALSLTIDLSLLPAFAISAAISFLTYAKFRSSVETAFNADQTSKTDVASHLLKSWDNLFLNNKRIHQNYSRQFAEKMARAQTNSASSATRAESLVFWLGMAAGLPVLISVCWILFNPVTSNPTPVLVALLATLPRQMNILGIFRNVFQSLTNLLSIEAKFQVICEGTNLPKRDLAHSIKAPDIQINHRPLNEVSKLISDLSLSQNGRFEVRGANGAGKSTLLLLLNQVLLSSVYLPTHPDLMISMHPSLSRSSGENLLAHVEFLKSSEEDVILLDEWDANLDATNLKLINDILNELSQVKTVVEVRHRT